MHHDESAPEHPRSTAAGAWVRLVAVVAARGVVAAVLGFAVWAAGPALLGWQVTTVVSDSMQPAIATGDVIAARPTPADELQIGQVLLTPDPDHADRLRLHRYDARADDGSVITRGDANEQPDSSPIAADDVLGVGALRVPWAGQPIVWLHEQQWPPLVLTVAAMLATLALAIQPALRVADEPNTASAQMVRDPALAATPPARRRRMLVVCIAAVVASLMALVGAPLAAAHAAFSATTGQHATLATATATAPAQVRCVNNTNGTVTISWEHPGGNAGFTTLVDGRDRNSLGPDSRSATFSTQSLFSWSRQTIAIRSDLGGTWTATSRTVTVSVFSFLGLGSVRCA